MRRIAIAALALAAVSPAGAFAHGTHDVQDAKDCRSKDQAAATTTANGASEADRLSICVTQGGTTVFYFGGEMQSEDPRNDGFGGTCGAVIVGGQNVAQGKYGEDWYHPGNSGDFKC